MKKFSSGLILGGMLCAIGFATFLSDKKNRRSLKKQGDKFLNKTSNMLDDLYD